jgi:hypothetical protein
MLGAREQRGRPLLLLLLLLVLIWVCVAALF